MTPLPHIFSASWWNLRLLSESVQFIYKHPAWVKNQTLLQLHSVQIWFHSTTVETSAPVLNFAWTWLLYLIHRSSNSDVYVSSVIKYWLWVGGWPELPTQSISTDDRVFDKPGVRVNTLQIAPLNINLAQKIIQLRTIWKLSFQLMLWLRCRRQFWRKVLDCWIRQSLILSEHQLIIDRPQASIFNNLRMRLNNQLSFWVIWWQ